MKKIIVVLAACAMLAVAVNASASVQAGDTTVDGSIAYSRYSSGDYSDWDVTTQISFGRFLTEAISLEGSAYGSFGDNTKMIGLLLKPNYHFNTGTSNVPYVGIALGAFLTEIDFGFGDYKETDFVYGAQAGIKQFISEKAFIKWEASYLKVDMDPEDTDIFQLFVGFGFKF